MLDLPTNLTALRAWWPMPSYFFSYFFFKILTSFLGFDDRCQNSWTEEKVYLMERDRLLEEYKKRVNFPPLFLSHASKQARRTGLPSWGIEFLCGKYLPSRYRRLSYCVGIGKMSAVNRRLGCVQEIISTVDLTPHGNFIWKCFEGSIPWKWWH